ncbi:MAG: QueT transporter family protein, partial [Bacilli bacterium]|nr:QueT transporter family protein [Bacilli bacterium]
MKNKVIRSITNNGIVIALYFLLTLAGQSFAFGMIQIRVAEILVLLCFFRRDYTIGVTLGCVLSNLLLSYIGIWDMVFGSLATLISCLLISFSKHLFIST